MIKTLKNPIKVRGYDMYDKFKVRGILRYDVELRRMLVSCSYGYVKVGKFIPSELKEHHITKEFTGLEFDKINARIRQKDMGFIWDIIEQRILMVLQEREGLFKEEKDNERVA